MTDPLCPPRCSPPRRPLRLPRPWGLLLLLGLLVAPAQTGPATAGPGEEELRPIAIERDDLAIHGATRIQRGVYRLRDENGNGVLRITQDGVVLDLAGATLIGAPEGADPDTYTGVGIEVVGARNVTIRGGRIRGFRVALRARNAPGLRVLGLDASENFRQRLRSTPEREDPSDWLWPHENDKDEWQTRYGAGFSLTECARAQVSGCRARAGQNGLLLTRCNKCRVFDNDFSFNSGWGIALYRSSGCVVSHNSCDWCVRGYSHGVYQRGQDSAGILVFEQSSMNRFVRNSATHGGDGFFLYAGHETTQRTGRGGSNDNLVFENDFSHAVANGIEATFSRGNVFVRNDCSDCEHGIWAGYSSDSLFLGNKITRSRSAGISIEHGRENHLQFNRIVGGPIGIHLWWDLDAAFVNGVFGEHNSTASEGSVILGNDILGAQTAVRLVRDTGTTLRWNVLSAKRTILHLGPGTQLAQVEHNLFRGPRARRGRVPQAVLDESGHDWSLPPTNSRRGPLAGTGRLDPLRLTDDPGFLRLRARRPETPQVPGHRSTALPAGMPRGCKQIRIGPFGPLDPRLPHVSPREIEAPGGNATVHLSGRGSYSITGIEGRITVAPLQGRLPARVEIGLRPAPAGALPLALVPFSFQVELGLGTERVSGSLLQTSWDVHFFEWSEDPREHPASLLALLETEPALTQRLPALVFRWRAGGPKGVAHDHFATLAETTVRLSAGRYRIRTISDDGIRVYVDGKRVTDNWTHHAPTEDVVDLTLTAGEHRIRVEHFELNGHAQLEFVLSRLP